MAATVSVGDKQVVVLDNGSSSIKIGYGGANFPTAVVPTIVGRPMLRSSSLKAAAGAAEPVIGLSKSADPSAAAVTDLKEIMIGDETTSLRHLLDINAPLLNGIVRDENDLMLLWDYSFHKKMRVNPAECFISTSEPPSYGDVHRGKIFEMLFEKVGIAGIQTNLQGALILYSTGETTGLAVDCGETVSTCQPIFEGFGLRKGNMRVNIGGRNVTEYLIRLMQRRGYDFNKSADFETVRCIKEMFCYAAVDPKLERKLALETTVLEKAMTLPDGHSCVIGAERFQAPEVLFNPGLLNIDCDGLSQQLWNSIQVCEIDTRAALYSNVVLSGGSSMFPGLPSRLERDMKAFFLEKSLKGDVSRLGRFKLRIVDAPRRKNMVFQGSSCYAALCAGEVEHWMTKAQWEEEGVSGVTSRFAQRT